MRYSQALLDEIRRRIVLSELVATRVTWDRRKTNERKGEYWACCPWHSEKSPSFHVLNDRGRYHCFGCGVSGDAFDFVVETGGVAFVEAVKDLAARAGVDLPVESEAEARRDRRRLELTEVVARAATFYQAQLRTPAGAAAHAYLHGRGITDAAIERFGLGYAPNERTALRGELANAGVGKADMIEAGLLADDEDTAVTYDRFRDRIMFPVANDRGQVVGFSGRAMSPDARAKYLNSPETPIFSKGDLLFNGKAAREAARAGHTPVLVEGNLDTVSSVMAGFEATVAPMGTAVTESQLRQLWRMHPEPVVCMDGDGAGVRAAGRLADLALPHLMPAKTLRFAALPVGDDPDSHIRTAGAASYRRALTAASPLVDVLWRRETHGKTFVTPEAVAGLRTDLEAVAAKVGDKDVRQAYREAFRARVAGMVAPPRVVRSNGFSLRSASPATQRLTHGAASGMSLREAVAVVTMIRAPIVVMSMAEELTSDRVPAAVRDMASAMTMMMSEEPDASPETWLGRLDGQVIARAEGLCATAGLSLGDDAAAILRDVVSGR